MDKYEKLKNRLKGPVFPVPVPFTESEDVDYHALEQYVDMLAGYEVPAIMATVGTSRYNLLTREEMLAVNETIASTAAGRSMTIAAGPGPASGSTRENIQFAEKATVAGADAILVVYPERWYADGDVIGFFHTIADQAELGIMVHAVPMRDGFGGVSAIKHLDADLLEKIAEKENVIGVKEENADRKVYEEIRDRLNDRLPIIGAGGAMRRFMGDAKQGASAYLVGLGSFRPDLAMQFYDAVMGGDEEKAEAITSRYEDVYFPLAVELGWHRALKETLHLVHGMSPYERKPLSRVGSEGQSRLYDKLKEMECLNNAASTVLA